MISLLQTSSLNFERDGGSGYYNTAGDWVEGSTTTVETKGSLQPFKQGDNQTILPEGITANDTRIYYTVTQLKTGSQYIKQDADYTVIDGLEYEVFAVEDWSRYGLSVDHYKCILVRRDLNTGAS